MRVAKDGWVEIRRSLLGAESYTTPVSKMEKRRSSLLLMHLCPPQNSREDAVAGCNLWRHKSTKIMEISFSDGGAYIAACYGPHDCD